MQGLGYFIQSYAQQMQKNKEQSLRDEYLKAQKKIMDAKWKAYEMEEQYWASAPPEIRKVRYAPKMVQAFAYLKSGLTPPPGVGNVDISGQTQDWPTMKEMAQMPQPDTNQGVSDIISQARTNPMMAAVLKSAGVPIEPLKFIPAMTPEGGPGRQGMDPISGQPYGKIIPSPILHETFTETIPGKGTFQSLINPYTGKLLSEEQGIPAGRKIKPAERETRTEETGDMPGVIQQYDVYKGTDKEIPGSRRYKQKGSKLGEEATSKLSEFEVYSQTMAEIQEMVDKGTVDTGPFEPFKKVLDNFGILPKKDRIKLRSLVARLPGLMYAMRGKQLSDKELEVALNMMPQMEMDDVAFAIQLQGFGNYMTSILESKQKMFKQVGFKVPEFNNKNTNNVNTDVNQNMDLGEDPLGWRK